MERRFRSKPRLGWVKVPLEVPVPELEWSEVIVEYIGFVSAFLAAGAVGFRFSALGRRLAAVAGDPHLARDAARRAAGLGLAGAVVTLGLSGYALVELAARRHTTAVALLGDRQLGAGLGLDVLAAAGLGLALARVRAGWWLAAVGVLGAALPGLLSGRWQKLVNPTHALVGGLWLGTLLVLLVAGLGPVLRDPRLRERRGAIAAALVQGFSPLALVCGGLVVVTGGLTAWNHLPSWDALLGTDYGRVLLVKLTLVAVVFALGAWNWRRQKPLLGTEDAALGLRRSARAEVGVAAVVLLVTAVLVSVPSPRPPRPAGPPVGAGAPGAGTE